MAARLMPDEEPIVLTRSHWSVVVPAVGVAVLLLAVVVVILVVLPGRVGSASTGTVKTVAGLVIGLALLAWVVLRLLRWWLTTYLLTDRRVVLESGVLSRREESIPLDRVQNTVVRRPLGDRMIGAGNIEIESAGRDSAEILYRVPNAQRFYTQLLDAMEAVRSSGPPPTQRPV
jgi:uncharacterized membrane protein YdbT with pleckstrin-like domain